MATLAANSTGNFLTAGTWSLIDASSTTGTSYLNSETGTETLTTAFSGTLGAAFLWAVTAPVIDGIAIKISNRTGTTGTISVHLEVATVEVTGTLVTIDMDDLPAIATADINGGWTFFKFAAPVTLSAATSYSVAAKTSTAAMCNVYRDGTADNLSHYIRTTTTQAPAVGDDLVITGDYTASNTSAAITVTMDALASSITDYGAASTSLVTPSLAICSLGTLSYGATAATNYYLRQSGNVIIYSGGTLSIGTTGTPIPRDSSAVLNFDCASNVDFGLTVRNLGTFNAQGLSRTSGKNIVSCLLNTDEAVNSTNLGIDTDTGWLDNDVIAVASTTRTASECESGALNGDAGASSLTVDGFGGAGGGLASAHSGTSPTQAEVILLTRNIQVFGASSSLQGYIDIKATSTVDIDWAEFKWLGSATANKRGIDTACTTGTQSFKYSSFHDFVVASSRGLNLSGASGTGLTFSNNVTFNIANAHVQFVANSGSSVFDTNIFMKTNDSTQTLIFFTDVGSTFTNNTMIGATGNGVTIGEASAIGTISNIISHSNAVFGISFTGASSGVVATITSWRNGSSGLSFNSSGLPYLIITNGILFGNTSQNISIDSSTGYIVLDNFTVNGDTTFSTSNGINHSVLGSCIGYMLILNSNFGTASGIKTAHTNDIAIPSVTNSFYNIVLNNSILASTVEVLLQTSLSPVSFISSQKHDQTAGNHKTWKKYGTITVDTTANMFHTASPSERLTPNNASGKLESGSKKIAVANGATLTPSVWVRASVAGDGTDYNGGDIRLILKRNDAIGITADTVLDTYTDGDSGTFGELTATTAAATDDGVMEFLVDCDGTTGWVNVDDWSVT